MLVQPRSFVVAQRSQERGIVTDFSFFEQTDYEIEQRRRFRQARKMLLVHQAGSVKVGEVVRYTFTYTPSNDRILPTPSHLHLKVKNTCAIPLRAAWVHGPYALHAAAYPATFNPHHKVEDPKKDGVPEYEPMVKAGGSWSTKLLVPESIRETGADLGKRRPSNADAQQDGKKTMTWVIEIASQILFSNSASVDFEVLIGRDERSFDLGFAAVAGHGHGGPGQVKDMQSEKERREARKRGNVQAEGVYSKAVRLVVENTETLWDKPPLPTWEDGKDSKGQKSAGDSKSKKERKRRNVHLVVVTHGLHSNLGADMLFLKESIDATVAQAREDAKKRKQAYRESQQKASREFEGGETQDEQKPSQKIDENDTSTAPLSGGQEELNNAPDEDDDEEETIVRGFPGNSCRTENGIQYLGKRLAKYILRFTYPDQPFLPMKKTFSRKFTDSFSSEAAKAKRDGAAAHHGSSIHEPAGTSPRRAEELPYKFTSISFVGHSLGGLIQTYAIAYIHKHSPTFFQQIKPMNFICMASPMLGLSNENPMYVKFALDFGLVGRTGQDLGLTWRPPTIASKGWNAVVNGFSNTSQKDKDAKQPDPTAKPLLRILPTGPAHQVLRMFRNRTVYSNVVNDGIVPLRTSCLLFLDWRGLGKVDKARRENGLIGTVAEWGWAEITGANLSTLAPNVRAEQIMSSDDEDNDQVRHGQGEEVPQPDENETAEDNKLSTNRVSYEDEDTSMPSTSGSPNRKQVPQEQQSKGMLDTFISFFRPNTPDKPKPAAPMSKKTTKALRRAQTVYNDDEESGDNVTNDHEGATTSNPTMRPHMPHLHTGQVEEKKRPAASRGSSMTGKTTGELQAPPKTSIFESAGDILHPPLPSRQWITDPSARARTIFHDRVYHPEDIPPPPIKKSNSRLFSVGGESTKGSVKSAGSASSEQSVKSQDSTSSETGGMKIEEKIARAYHRDLSWRKVLVRLEPDAHNNMIVRRMFANAYGWPVIKHLCDTHFADTYAATTRDEDEPARERAKPMDAPINADTGEEVENQTDKRVPERTHSETREARDELADLNSSRTGAASSYSSKTGHGSLHRQESAVWDDSYFEGSDGEDSDAVDERNFVAKIMNPNPAPIKKPEQAHHRRSTSSSSEAPSTPRVTYVDGHRGLAPTSPGSPRSPRVQRTSVEMRPSSAAKPTFDASDIEHVTSRQIVDEPQSITSPGSVAADVGLRKSVEEQVLNGSPSSSRKRPASKEGGR